ncbi:MAG: hypothetical protein AAGA92_02645 [Planctomycetota bacterium]
MRCLPATLRAVVLAASVASLAASVPAAAQQQAPEGSEIVLQALATLQRAPSLSASVRYTTAAEGDELLGTGRYLQRGTGQQRLSRLELQSQVAGETASLQQVFDGKFLWTEKRLPSGRSVSRVDVRRLLGGVAAAPRSLSDSPYRPDPLVETALARGGMAALVADLYTRFQFGPARQVQHQGEAVWAVVGSWTPEGLARALGEDGSEAAWPPVVPDHALLLVSLVDRLPRVVEYRRHRDADLRSGPSSIVPCRDPLVRYELFDVRLGPVLSLDEFRYVPGEVQVVDHTPLAAARIDEVAPRR